MKLIAKDEQTTDGKARGAAKAKGAAAKPALPAKPKKADAAKKAEGSKKAVKKSGEAGKSFIDTARDYLRDVVAELKKVVWPSRKQTLGTTGVVLVIVCLTSLFLGFVDVLFSRLLHFMVH
jgi:preprotein translocase subunit SecE